VGWIKYIPFVLIKKVIAQFLVFTWSLQCDMIKFKKGEFRMLIVKGQEKCEMFIYTNCLISGLYATYGEE
jgi:hypothetical protein